MDENPYAPPRLLSDEQTVYYAMDIARSSLGEIWRLTYPHPARFVIVLLFKLLGWPVSGNVAVAHGSLAFFQCSEASPHATTALESICRDCASLGFQKRFAHAISVLGDGEAWAIDLSNPAGTIASQALYVRSGKKTDVQVAFVSFLDNETVLSTTNGRRRLKTPPQIDACYLRGASVRQALARHESRIAGLTTARVRNFNDAELQEAIAQIARWAAKFHEARGVYASLTNAEVERLAAAERNQ